MPFEAALDLTTVVKHCNDLLLCHLDYASPAHSLCHLMT